MTEVTFREANKRYRRRVLPMMAFYVFLCCVGPVAMVLTGGPAEGPTWVMAFIAILTATPIAVVFWVLGRYLRETDEYTRAWQTEALLTGGGITLSLAVIWSFLELYHVVPRPEFFPSMMMVGPTFFLFYGLSAAVKHLRNGGKLRDMPGPGRGGS